MTIKYRWLSFSSRTIRLFTKRFYLHWVTKNKVERERATIHLPLVQTA